MKNSILGICTLINICCAIYFVFCGNSSSNENTVKQKYDFEWNESEFNIRNGTSKNAENEYEKLLTCIGGYLFFESNVGNYHYIPLEIFVLSEDGKSQHPIQCRIKNNEK